MRLLGRAGGSGHDEEFTAYYAARADHLRNTAYLLCGDWHLAQDLTQTAFTKLYRSWSRIERHDSLDRYARQVLVHAFLDERRRPWRRELPTGPDDAGFDTVAPTDPDPGDRLVLHTALTRVPKRRRAVLVLRFWADLSVEQVAEILDCSPGTVKSQTAHGLANLREALGSHLTDLKRTIPGGNS